MHLSLLFLVFPISGVHRCECLALLTKRNDRDGLLLLFIESSCPSGRRRLVPELAHLVLGIEIILMRTDLLEVIGQFGTWRHVYTLPLPVK